MRAVLAGGFRTAQRPARGQRCPVYHVYLDFVDGHFSHRFQLSAGAGTADGGARSLGGDDHRLGGACSSVFYPTAQRRLEKASAALMPAENKKRTVTRHRSFLCVSAESREIDQLDGGGNISFSRRLWLRIIGGKVFFVVEIKRILNAYSYIISL